MTPKVVLGVNPGAHDTGACVLKEAPREVRCWALSEERLNREKHSQRFPERSVAACLEAAGVRRADVDLVAFDKLDKRLFPTTSLALSACPPEAFHEHELAFFRSFPNAEIRLVNHHTAHAASAFHLSGMDEAAVLVVDGRGSCWPMGADDPGGADRLLDIGVRWQTRGHRLGPRAERAETQSIFRGRGRALERIDACTRAGIGFFYAWLTAQVLGFWRPEAGKSMGLAAWGDAQMALPFPEIPAACFDGMHTDVLQHLMAIGAALRERGAEPPTDAYFAGAAHWAQETLTRAMLHLSEVAAARCATPNLCLAGGVGLNIVANRAIRDRVEARGGRIFIQPAATDAGIPLGCAVYGYYALLGGTLPFQSNLVYLGPEHDQAAAEALLVSRGGRIHDDVFAATADLLKANKIVGWWQGRSEYGPRSLGSRSILCSPRTPWMKDHLNRHVKHRESFRPFAPIVREHLAPRYFDVAYPSPFMLFNTTVRAEYRDRLPAICHVDGTARLQTIHERDHPWMHALLAAWERVDEHGVLLNTSFNDAGEPIVETAEDAWRCFARTGIDALVCGNAIVLKDDVYVRPAAVAKRAPDGDPSRSGDLAARAAHT